MRKYSCSCFVPDVIPGASRSIKEVYKYWTIKVGVGNVYESITIDVSKIDGSHISEVPSARVIEKGSGEIIDEYPLGVYHCKNLSAIVVCDADLPVGMVLVKHVVEGSIGEVEVCVTISWCDETITLCAGVAFHII